jgi:hypothetical protein
MKTRITVNAKPKAQKKELSLGFWAISKEDKAHKINISTELYSVGIYIITKYPSELQPEGYSHTEMTTRNSVEKAHNYLDKLKKQFQKQGFKIKEKATVIIKQEVFFSYANPKTNIANLRKSLKKSEKRKKSK